MGEFSITHILLAAVIILILFGPKRLPELGKSMGEAIRGFKKAMNTDETKDVTSTQNSAQLLKKPENQSSIIQDEKVAERDVTKNNQGS